MPAVVPEDPVGDILGDDYLWGNPLGPTVSADTTPGSDLSGSVEATSFESSGLTQRKFHLGNVYVPCTRSTTA